MKKLWILAQKNSFILPESYAEWTDIYGIETVSVLIRASVLKLGERYSMVSELTIGGISYSIKLINGRILGHDDDGNVREFSEKEVGHLTLDSKGFAEAVAKAIGLENAIVDRFICGGNGFFLGEYTHSKNRYPLILCFNFINFENEIRVSQKDPYPVHPFVISVNDNLVSEEAKTVIRTLGGKIIPVTDCVEFSKDGVTWIFPMRDFLGISKASEQSEIKYKTIDKWTGDFPIGATWKDVSIKLFLVSKKIAIKYGESHKTYKIRVISFFSDENSIEWKIFTEILNKTAKYKNETQRRYVSMLNACFNKFFNLTGSPFSSRGNNGVYQSIFNLEVIDERDKLRRKELTVEYEDGSKSHTRLNPDNPQGPPMHI